MKIRILSFVTALCFLGSVYASKNYVLKSPDSKISVNVECGSKLIYSVDYDNNTVLAPSAVSMSLSDGMVWGPDSRVKKAERKSVNKMIDSPFTGTARMHENYNALTLRMKGGYDIEFRAYDDGVAYRFVSHCEKPFRVESEQADFVFPEDFEASVPYVRGGKPGDIASQYFNSFENSYTVLPLSKLDSGRLSFLPLAVKVGNGLTAVITETDLVDYPGLYIINKDGSTTLRSHHAPVPLETVRGGHKGIQGMVSKRADYIAEIQGERTFPWRVITIGDDKTLALSNLSYLLAGPSKIKDISWIKPGKVAWEWWNALNITGVDFRAGINTPTYRHYIDFASDNNIEYIILDSGWAEGLGQDLLKVNPDVNLEELVEYGNSKGVGIILWAGYLPMEQDMERVCRHYSEMGIKGFKVDFEDRDDQAMVAFNHRLAETAAKYHLIVDIHGSYKPAGINRTWPNVLNVEGVRGMENLKWDATMTDFDILEYDTQIPFLRQISGPLDYTQGAMDNAVPDDFRAICNNPMSIGTRSHQLALYVIFYSPLNMLCDTPDKYRREQECTDFIAAVPTIWDETKVLSACRGDYIVMARRNGNRWFVGGITDRSARDIEVDLSTLGLTHPARMTIFRDGINADRNGNDYVRELRMIDGKDKLNIHLAPGGGFAAEIKVSDK